VAGTLHPFDDRAVLREALARCAPAGVEPRP
jgi:UDP-N-acetylmuramoyl-L-alanyl-D-glutamate--2,6-diaminopimelate ligase